VRRWKWFWLPIILGSILFGLRCGEDSGPGPELPRLVINSDSADQEVSSTQQFEALYGDEPVDVIWQVDGVVGGAPWSGMITNGGLYIAPSSVPEGGTVRIGATAVEDTSVKASVTVEISANGEPAYVTVDPDTATVAVTGSCVFAGSVMNCESHYVSWSIQPINVNPLDLGEITADGTYIAPASAAADIEVLVRATSIGCPGKSGVAKVVVPAQARAFTVELESYVDSHDSVGVPRTEPIAAVGCTYASGGKSVVGMDNPGEYIIVPMTVPGSGTYTASVRYAAWTGDTLHVRLQVEDCGQSGQDEYLLTEGTGLG
jgi:hypothetical protein